MKVLSKRYGFACNSSSTHSTVILNKNIDVYEVIQLAIKKKQSELWRAFDLAKQSEERLKDETLPERQKDSCKEDIDNAISLFYEVGLNYDAYEAVEDIPEIIEPYLIEVNEDRDFGYGHFMITDKTVLTRYFTLILAEQITDLSHSLNYQAFNLSYDKEIDRILIKQLLPGTLYETLIFDANGDIDGYVDHQSEFKFPSSKRNNYPDIELASKLIKLIVNTPNLAVLGGDHPMLYHSERYNHELYDFIAYRQRTWCRYDKLGFYSLYDPRGGDKLRFSFEDDFILTHSSIPELVDLKITDYCTKGCAFCYQSSTGAGKHGNLKYIYSIIDALAKLGTFEIAIGGGEPTSHPRIISILEYCKKANIIPNLTTKSQKWFKDEELKEKITGLTGAIALSIGSAKELQSWLDIDCYLSTDFTVQIVLGTITREELESILDLAKMNELRVTLLGYKPVGFGKDFNFIPYTDYVMDIIKTYPNLSIDSALLSEIESKLLEIGLDKRFITDKEGKFSCYIDAVEMFIAKDSYSECKKYPFDLKDNHFNKGDIAKAYKKISTTP